MTHPVHRPLEDGHAGAQAQSDHRRVVTDHPAADHHDLAGGDTRDPSEQESAAAERLLAEIGARVNGSSAARCRYVKRTRPSRSRRYSGSTCSFTFISSSLASHTSSTPTTRA